MLDLPRAERAARLLAVEHEDPALAAALRPLVDADADATDQAFLTGKVGTTSGADAGTRGSIDPDGLIGLTLGAYTLVSRLGQGGAGSVWRARRSDGRYDGEAAVKLLHLSLLGRAAAERFRREGAILARLQHPHIAALLDAGVAAGGQPYLVLELVQGEPIDAYCRRLRLDVEARLRLFLDVLAAVSHAHRHLVVHRDLKPANVLVTAGGQVKLLDFGIAKLLADEHGAAGATALTQEGGRALTPAYAAPEQFEHGDITTATDVYALGVVLYELLGGRHPTSPNGGNLFDIVRATQQQEPRRLSRAPRSAFSMRWR